ncbi:MAG: type II toxin-antitoxin system VapC family toxin, partial [Gammaproteobacteria bacterium]|nr:type II toxin-antitoxin system VapC family toxin [Gammaproteobacteria bacterium]
MTCLVDTCGWIEWLVDGPLANRFRHYLANPEQLIVSTSLQYELYKWICRERDETLALEIVALTEAGQVEPQTTSVALHAADLALVYRLAFADAIIYATARQE